MGLMGPTGLIVLMRLKGLMGIALAIALAVELGDEIGAAYAPERLLNGTALFWLVPEEELALGLLFAGRMG